MAAEPDHVYVIPPNTFITISHGNLHLIPRTDIQGQYMPIDYFLASLAEDCKDNAIAVVLSGTGTKGSLGVKTVKAEGGIVFAQDEKTAKYNGMPHTAISSGYVDFILPPKKIADELTRISRHPYVTAPKAEVLPEVPVDSDAIEKIFTLIKKVTRVDFTHYKRSTMTRRIMSRMLLHRIDNMKNYALYLQDNPSEVTKSAISMNT